MLEATPLEKISPEEQATPLANHQCPLCGQPNRCAPADTGNFVSPCWCTAQTFPADLLAQVDPAERNKSCICQECVKRFQDSHTR
jgi:hypothetical protein